MHRTNNEVNERGHSQSHIEISEDASYVNFKIDKLRSAVYNLTSDFARSRPDIFPDFNRHRPGENVIFHFDKQSLALFRKMIVRMHNLYYASSMHTMHTSDNIGESNAQHFFVFSDAEFFEILISFLYPSFFISADTDDNDSGTLNYRLTNYSELAWKEVLDKGRDRSEFLTLLLRHNNSDSFYINASYYNFSQAKNGIDISRTESELVDIAKKLVDVDISAALALDIAHVDFHTTPRVFHSKHWRTEHDNFIRERLQA